MHVRRILLESKYVRQVVGYESSELRSTNNEISRNVRGVICLLGLCHAKLNKKRNSDLGTPLLLFLKEACFENYAAAVDFTVYFFWVFGQADASYFCSALDYH